MTNKERMMAFVQGKPMDRVPFVQYDNIGGSNEEIWSALGRENMGILQWTEAVRTTTAHCHITTVEIARDGKHGWRDTLHTPAGTLWQERMAVPALPGVTSIEKHYVTEFEDYRVLLAYYQDMQIEPAPELVQAVWDRLGDDGIPHVWIGRTPYQKLWVEWVSVMDLSFHLADDALLMEEVFSCLGTWINTQAAATAEAGRSVVIPYVDIGDNITAPLIGADRFSRYCIPYYQSVHELLSPMDLQLVVHMDGDLLPLAGLIASSPVRGLDSFSPQPDNDTSVSDALRLWPHMKLMMNFPSSVHLWEPQEIYKKTREFLADAEGTGRLQIQVSEDPPPGRWKISYPQIIRAIHDHCGTGR